MKATFYHVPRAGIRQRISFTMAMALIIASFPLLALPAGAADNLPILWQAGGLSAGTDSAGQSARMTADAAGNVAVVSGPGDGRDLVVTSYTPTGSFRWASAVSPSIGDVHQETGWLLHPTGITSRSVTMSDPVGTRLRSPWFATASAGSSNGGSTSPGPSPGRPLTRRLRRQCLPRLQLAGDGQDIQVHKYSPSGTLLWSNVSPRASSPTTSPHRWL